jgi:hypothetical protein
MAEGTADVCICVLFYGAENKHFKLAQRVLNEPMRCLAKRNVEFRFGCNAVGAETTSFLQRQIAEHFHTTILFHSANNIMKYPMMREMLYAPPVRAPVTMWFDHDSYLDLDPDDNIDSWFDRVVKQVQGCNLLGSVQKAKLTPAQFAWAEQQPWFDAQRANTYFSYPIGGWWAAQTAFLRQFDWPAVNFQQKGGDVILGAAFKHQNIPFCHFRQGVRISANDMGVESPLAQSMA